MQAGYPAAPLQLTDELNLKLMQKVRAETEKAETGAGKIATELAAYPVIDTLVEAGRPGRLEKAGFYEYDEDGKRIGLWEGLRDTFKTSTELPVPFQDLIDRMLFIEAIETQKCFDEGVLTTPADANIGSIFGIGYPAWTGGVHQFIVGYLTGRRSRQPTKHRLSRSGLLAEYLTIFRIIMRSSIIGSADSLPARSHV
jgi:3-hydroxyacyl-CoA dehydrogenase/enoyl-CoA hydratase/3-hydroxybutyryl-CoA epimerase